MISVFALMLQAPPSDSGALMRLFLPMIGFILIFWFLIIGPQRKSAQKHQEMLGALKAGDEVVTDGGLIGTVLHIKEDRVTLRTGENTRVVVLRSKIGRVLTPPSEAGTTA